MLPDLPSERLVPLVIVHRNKEGETVDIEVINPGYVAVWVGRVAQGVSQ